MRDVPPGSSGAASGVLNASRQIGTSIGLAVIGAIGANAAVSAWAARAARFPAAVRADAMGGGPEQDVAGARIGAVGRALGAGYRQAATDAFVHGYRLAVGAGAACLLAAACVAALGLRGGRGYAESMAEQPVEVP